MTLPEPELPYVVMCDYGYEGMRIESQHERAEGAIAAALEHSYGRLSVWKRVRFQERREADTETLAALKELHLETLPYADGRDNSKAIGAARTRAILAIHKAEDSP